MKNKDFAVSISAFTLPEYSILVQNSISSYRNYFVKNKLPCNRSKITEENKKRISRHVNICHGEAREPKLYIKLTNTKRKYNNMASLKNGESVYIKVTMDQEDEVFFSKLKYEVSFFVDFQFVSEEEMGYMPIGWNFVPNGLKKGEHTLSVNVSSLTGQVGTKHIKFFIE